MELYNKTLFYTELEIRNTDYQFLNLFRIRCTLFIFLTKKIFKKKFYFYKLEKYLLMFLYFLYSDLETWNWCPVLLEKVM